MNNQQAIDEELLKQYEQELAQAQAQNNNSYASSTFGGQPKQNLVEWQLDFKPELVEIERLLRCDVIQRDDNGNEIWVTNPRQEKIVFNSTGVNDILRQIRMFLNKNKVLSNYALDEIKPRIRMIGHELRMLIYNNYETYGLDNDYKMNNYSIVVLTILSMIEDSYRRAINGEERKDLNQARIVNQNDPLMPNNMPYGMMPQRPGKKSLFKPWTWGQD